MQLDHYILFMSPGKICFVLSKKQSFEIYTSFYSFAVQKLLIIFQQKNITAIDFVRHVSLN